MNVRVSVLDDAAFAAELQWVKRLAKSLLADENDADDVAQEAFIKASATPAGFASRSGLRAWMAAVTRRLARDLHRVRARRAEREKRAAKPEALPSTSDVVERSAFLETLVHAVRALPEPNRSTVLHRYLDGLSTEEIARKTCVSEVAVRKRLSRGLAELRRVLEHEFGGDPRSALLALLGPLPVKDLATLRKLSATLGTAAALVCAASAAGYLALDAQSGRPGSAEPSLADLAPVPLLSSVAPGPKEPCTASGSCTRRGRARR